MFANRGYVACDGQAISVEKNERRYLDVDVDKSCVTEVYSLGTSSVVPAWRRWDLCIPLIWRILSTEAP